MGHCDALDSIFYTSTQSPIFSHFPIDFIQTCALGGVSQAPFTGCNLAYHTGDLAESVTANRKHILRYFGENKQLLWCDQIHSAHIADATDPNIIHSLATGTIQADGIICASPSHIALIMVADCNPIIIYSPQDNIFALLHAGRAGVCGQILTKGVEALAQKGALIMVADCNPIIIYSPQDNIFALLHAGRAGVCGQILTKGVEALAQKGVDSRDMYVFIGSSIRACCYEISPPLARQIASTFGEKYIHTRNGSTTLDLVAMLQDECNALGIDKKHLEILDSCTMCDERLFSYRRASKAQAQTGRFGILASLRH